MSSIAEEDPPAADPTVVDSTTDDAAAAALAQQKAEEEAAAKAAREEAAAIAAAEAAAAAARRDQHIGTKVASVFGKDTYLGTVQSARTTDLPDGIDYYQVTYSDGDQEELEIAELESAQERYTVVVQEMWDTMIALVGLNDADVAALQSQGITSIVELELFGGGGGSGNRGFDSIPGLSLMTKQYLHIVATYLLNDGILTSKSTIPELARFNLAKQNGSMDRPIRKRAAPSTAAATTTTASTRKKRRTTTPKTKTVVVKAASKKTTGKKRGRPPTKKKTTTTTTVTVSKRPRGRPKRRG